MCIVASQERLAKYHEKNSISFGNINSNVFGNRLSAHTRKAVGSIEK